MSGPLRVSLLDMRGASGKRIPGEHYYDWGALGDREPQTHEFSGRCRHCFPKERHAERELEQQEVSDIGSASSSDSDLAVEEAEESAAGLAAEQ